MAYSKGEYGVDYKKLSINKNSAKTYYPYAFDVTLDMSNGNYSTQCNLFFESSWCVEWTVSSTDSGSGVPMFEAVM